MKLRCVIGLLFLCSTIAAFGQQGASHGSWIGHMFGYGFVFQVAAVIHWSRKRPEAFWLWIIIIGGIIGALAYFLIEGLPDLSNLQRTLRGPARRKRIQVLRALVMQNPSAGNYEELGELLLDDKRYREAREAFDRVGVHPERGAKTLLEWVTLFGNHVETHARQIRGIREAFAQR